MFDYNRIMCKIHAEAWFSLRPWRRHSLVLMVAGLVYMGIGYSYVEAEPTSTREQALQVASAWMPLHYWGYVFMVAGLITVISSRWPPVSKTWGYTVLTGLSAGWAAFYLIPIVFGASPITNTSAVMSWGLIAFLWWAISGLIEPADGLSV